MVAWLSYQLFPSFELIRGKNSSMVFLRVVLDEIFVISLMKGAFFTIVTKLVTTIISCSILTYASLLRKTFMSHYKAFPNLFGDLSIWDPIILIMSNATQKEILSLEVLLNILSIIIIVFFYCIQHKSSNITLYYCLHRHIGTITNDVP